MCRQGLPIVFISLVAVVAMVGWLRTAPQDDVDSEWLEIQQKAETAYNERYLLAVDSLNNMEVPNYGVANEIVHNYAMDMYYLREQFVTDYPEYEDQLHEQQRVIYGRDYTRLHKIRQSYSAVPK